MDYNRFHEKNLVLFAFEGTKCCGGDLDLVKFDLDLVRRQAKCDYNACQAPCNSDEANDMQDQYYSTSLQKVNGAEPGLQVTRVECGFVPFLPGGDYVWTFKRLADNP